MLKANLSFFLFAFTQVSLDFFDRHPFQEFFETYGLNDIFSSDSPDDIFSSGSLH